MDKGYLILKHASASRSSGEWDDDDFDVLADGVVVGRIMETACRAGRPAVDADARLWAPRGPHAHARLADRHKLAIGVIHAIRKAYMPCSSVILRQRSDDDRHARERLNVLAA
jgi:hypothetical protein